MPIMSTSSPVLSYDFCTMQLSWQRRGLLNLSKIAGISRLDDRMQLLCCIFFGGGGTLRSKSDCLLRTREYCLHVVIRPLIPITALPSFELPSTRSRRSISITRAFYMRCNPSEQQQKHSYLPTIFRETAGEMGRNLSALSDILGRLSRSTLSQSTLNDGTSACRIGVRADCR